MKRFITLCMAVMAAVTAVKGDEDGKHLFILSGQSNMAGLKPEDTFIPALEKALGKDSFIVTKQAKGGQPIIKWITKEHDKTKSPEAETLYPELVKAISKETSGQQIKSVTFLWMQGEKDSRSRDDVARYEERFQLLLEQLKKDFKFSEMNVVIGRLSDAGVQNDLWNQMRQVQEKLVKTLPKASLVNTDDLNDGLQARKEGNKEVKNDIHYTIEGYKIFGERLAAAALEMLGR